MVATKYRMRNSAMFVQKIEGYWNESGQKVWYISATCVTTKPNGAK